MRRLLPLLLLACTPAGGTPAPTADVELVVDSNGWPHVFASSLRDAAFAQGYAIARERMPQLELFRRIANGELAEALGAVSAKFVESDVTMRTLGLRHVAAEMWERTAPGRSRELLEGYAAGVNRHLAELRDGRERVPRGAELLLGPRTRDWTPADSLAVLRLMELFLNFNADAEIERTLLLDRAGPELFEHLVRFDPPSRASTVPDFYAQVLTPLQRVLPPEDRLAVGTNAWAVSGARSKSGHALLANDPHLPLTSPSMLFGVHLVVTGGADALDVTGTAFPGVPGVVFGHNARVAWGICNAMLDQMDVYEETLVDDTVVFAGVQLPLERRVERIATGLGGFIDYTVEVVPHHGPILPVFEREGVPRARSGSSALSVRWVALQPTHEVDGLLALLYARDVAEARAAVKPIEAPGMAFVLADSAGDIGFQLVGKVPVRAAGARPAFVLPGDGSAEWVGWVQPEQLPWSGTRPFLAAANNDPAGVARDGDPFDAPVYLGYDFAEGFRAERIAERLGVLDGRATREDMEALQADTVMLAAKRFAPWFPQGPLREWDFDARADAVEPTMFHAWLWRLSEATLGDELEAIGMKLGARQKLIAVLAALESPDVSPLWDDVRTRGVVETRDDLLERVSRDLPRDRWGARHTLRFEPLLPHVALYLGQDVSFPPRGEPAFERGGGIETVDQGWPVMDGEDFHFTQGAARRLTVELTPDGPIAFDALPTPRSAELWRTNRSHALPRTRDELADEALTRTTLHP